MAETKTAGSGSWNLDGMAAKLQAKAEEVLHSTASIGTDEDGAATATGSKRAALRNVANIVKEQAGRGLETSKEYLSQVVEKVTTYANDASTTASAQLADAKEKGSAHFSAASGAANVHYAAVKEKASTHIAGLQTNLNKAVAQGQAQATSGSGTTDRALPADEEPLKFPFNVIAWFVSLCHGKLGPSTTTTTTSESTTSTSKDFSVESLQNAAATLTDTLAEGAHSVRAEGENAVASASEKLEAAKSSGTTKVESTA